MMAVIVKNMLTVIIMMVMEMMMMIMMAMIMMMMMIEMGKMDDDTGVVCACYPASAELGPLPAW